MKKNFLNPIYLEIAGATLILVSAWWQIYLEQPNADIAVGQQQYLMERKIDGLYHITSAIYSSQQLSQNPDRDIPAVSTSLRGIDDGWSLAGSEENPAKLAHERLRGLRSVVFILGSILVIAGKVASVKNRPGTCCCKQKHAQESE